MADLRRTTTSVNTAEAARRFEKAAKAYGKKATSSKKRARATLVKLGIYTRSLRLSKNYK